MPNKIISNCDECIHYVFDEYSDCYICQVNLDEDEMVRFMQGSFSNCPYYRLNDDYMLAKKQ